MPRDIGGKWKIAQYLCKHVGEVVNGADLMAVTGGQSDYARRIRELRQELGYKIESSHDRSDLGQREYILTELPPRVPTPEANRGYTFRRNIPPSVRSVVLARNGFTCQHCGVGVGEVQSDGRPVRLHIGHIHDADSGGPVSEHNLVALCQECNQGEKNRMPDPPKFAKVMALLRPADLETQKRALEFLKSKFSE